MTIPPPLLELFRKFIRFGRAIRPLHRSSSQSNSGELCVTNGSIFVWECHYRCWLIDWSSKMPSWQSHIGKPCMASNLLWKRGFPTQHVTHDLAARDGGVKLISVFSTYIFFFAATHDLAGRGRVEWNYLQTLCVLRTRMPYLHHGLLSIEEKPEGGRV